MKNARKLAAWGLRFGLGTVLLVSGGLKAADPAGFATEVANYQLLPALAPWVAMFLPALEVVVGAALVLGPWKWVRAGAFLAAGLFALFTGAVASVVWRGVNIACGCFGSNSGLVTEWTIVRNGVLVAAAVLLFFLQGLSPQQNSSLRSTR